MPLDQQRLRSALGQLGQTEQAALIEQLQARHFSGCLTPATRPAIELAPQLVALAAQFAIAPLSVFQVGAVAVGASGRLFLGANLEFAAAPLSASLHAEQSALLNAWMHGERAIHTLAISTAPCGHCRQFLSELSNAATLTIYVKQTRTTLKNLYPMPFGAPRPAGHGLLDSPATELGHVHPLRGESAQRAFNAAQHSYVPYTGAAEGFAITCADGHSYSGRAAESCAFNPSIPAAISALNQRNLSSSRDAPIIACCHATSATEQHSNRELSASLLRRLSDAPIQSVPLEARQMGLPE
jgi:cytidine deaminase